MFIVKLIMEIKEIKEFSDFTLNSLTSLISLLLVPPILSSERVRYGASRKKAVADSTKRYSRH